MVTMPYIAGVGMIPFTTEASAQPGQRIEGQGAAQPLDKAAIALQHNLGLAGPSGVTSFAPHRGRA
jgi:hypothetical protein